MRRNIMTIFIYYRHKLLNLVFCSIQLHVKRQMIVKVQSYFTTGALSPIGSSWPLEAHDKRFFLQLNPCAHSSYLTSSVTGRWVCVL
jgi:hypothetical protein